ncbi:AP-4 complex subunit mu-like isoform X2 [Pomacea canaliculata]|uniref:AP-4 complex subunit mu-like isoform X2 n=1 Tax=Pomacea canaliculata TaxID=400727 RepID=UPI000D72A2F4|nr:AP-4 complex subunit mu-like isoform X2 [Pomacea canaliculata]
MIYEIYIATCTTRSVLLRKNYRPLHVDGSSQSSWEIFCRKRQKITEGSIAPHFVEDGIHFYYIRRGGLLFVATSVKDVCATTVIEFLSRLYYMAKDFCGIVTEESVKANSLLLHEILCDVMDFGYVQIVSSEKVKPYVTSEAITMGSCASDPEELVTRLFGIESHRAPATAAHRPAVRTSLDGGQKNEIFVDLIERLTVVTDAKGNIGRMQVQGTINVKNFLLGHPKVKVALNEDLQISSRDQVKGFGSSALLDRCNFHQCVDLSEFDTSRIISFLPPPGEFSAMVYSLNEVGLNLPLRVTFFTRDIPNSRDVNVIMSVYCNILGTIGLLMLSSHFVFRLQYPVYHST